MLESSPIPYPVKQEKALDVHLVLQRRDMI